MKKKIAILGSTGSIGKSLLKIIKKDKKNFQIKFLSANKNYRELFKQAKFFNVKNVILTNKRAFFNSESLFKKNKINIHNNYNAIDNFLNSKLDYAMSSIVGIDGLVPTFKIIKHTNNIAIANKESIICGWNLIKKELDKYKTKFIPVDSEHFSIWYAIKNNSFKNIKKIYLTASGGPLLNVPFKKFNELNIKNIVKHPTWRMGKKISVDSSTMMNKVFEIIEAKKIFNLKYSQISILIHPKSYLHAVILFKDRMIKIIAHDTTMDIPIFNTLYSKINLNERNNKSFDLDLIKINNLSLSKIDEDKFPVIHLLKNLPTKNSLYETIIVTTNDILVDLFLRKKIKYTDISYLLLKIINLREFKQYKKISPKKIEDIVKLRDYVRLKFNTMSV